MKTIFVVDDNDVNLLTAEKALAEHYNVITLNSAEGMFELLEDATPDLILLDIEMPEINGFEALEKLNENDETARIPVIFLTSRNDESAETHGFDMGAVDFITKPFSKPVLLKRIKSHLAIEQLVRERTAKLQRLQTSMVSVLSNIVEKRDILTGEHIERTTKYIKILLDAMLERGIYADEIGEWDVESLILSARLHDVGKIIVSDLILNKPGKLIDEEYEKMKKHTSEGERIIDDIIHDSGDVAFLHNARLFAGCHHERWDGTGYPHRMKGEEIPLQGRIMAIADVYDALVSERPYKPAFTHKKAKEIIAENRGTQFDPKLVDVFLGISDLFEEAAKEL